MGGMVGGWEGGGLVGWGKDEGWRVRMEEGTK